MCPTSQPDLDAKTPAVTTRPDGSHYDILPANAYFCPTRQAFFDAQTDAPKDEVFNARWWGIREEFPKAPKQRR